MNECTDVYKGIEEKESHITICVYIHIQEERKNHNVAQEKSPLKST